MDYSQYFCCSLALVNRRRIFLKLHNAVFSLVPEKSSPQTHFIQTPVQPALRLLLPRVLVRGPRRGRRRRHRLRLPPPLRAGRRRHRGQRRRRRRPHRGRRERHHAVQGLEAGEGRQVGSGEAAAAAAAAVVRAAHAGGRRRC